MARDQVTDHYLQWLDKQIDTEWNNILKYKKLSAMGMDSADEDAKSAIAFHTAFLQARAKYMELKGVK